MESDNNTISSVAYIIAFIFGFYLVDQLSCRSKYQVASFGQNGAIVIDKRSGETWVTDSYIQHIGQPGEETIFYLKPVGYCDSQNDDYAYTPDEKRNDKNTSWDMWLRRRWNKKYKRKNLSEQF